MTDESQSENLPSPFPVRFTGCYDLVEDQPIPGSLIGYGHSVDAAWKDACDHRARDTTDMTYDDYEGA